MAGTLSATFAIGASSNAPLSGGSALTAQTLVGFARAAGLTAGGYLDASALSRFARSASLLGVGTYSAASQQIYPLAPSLSGGGTLSALAVIGLTDNFDRADSTIGLGVATPGGATWMNRVGVLGILGNTAVAAIDGANNIATYGYLASADDMEVSITLGVFTFGSDSFDIILGANSAGEGVKVRFISGTEGVMSTVTSWGGATSATTSNLLTSYTAGDRLSLGRVGSVYTLRQNGTVMGTWDDTGAVVPRDSDHRIVGIRIQGSGGVPDYSRHIDSFTARPLSTTPAPATPFVPFDVENTTVSNDPVPAGATGCWLTLIGNGGKGGNGGTSSGGSVRGGGGGGGGGGYYPRFWIPVASLGSTYSLSRGTGTSPANSVFTSGSVTVTAASGGTGGLGVASGGAAGTGGAASSFGLSPSPTGYTGGAASAGTANTDPADATDQSTTTGGGGGGAGALQGGGNRTGGDGGNSATATGGGGGAGAGHDGDNGANATSLPAAGGGGGGNRVQAGNLQGGNGGIGGTPGGGGGGAGGRSAASGLSSAATGTIGGDGFCKVEWV